MKTIGVITGDIVGSSEILKAGDRDRLLEVMKETIRNWNEKNWSNAKIQIYRGDSFQIIVDDYHYTVDLALLFRANLIANSSSSLRWDARLGIGIGKGEYLVDELSESDGDVFNISGLIFDHLGKNTFLNIATTEPDFNLELNVSTPFVDDIVSNWTKTQADLYYISIMRGLNQKETAQLEDKSTQTISKVQIAGKFSLIANYVSRFHARVKPQSHSIQLKNKK